MVIKSLKFIYYLMLDGKIFQLSLSVILLLNKQ